MNTKNQHIEPLLRECTVCCKPTSLCVICLGSGRHRSDKRICGRCNTTGRNPRCDICRDGVKKPQDNQRIIGKKMVHAFHDPSNTLRENLITWCGVELKWRESTREYDESQITCFNCVRLSSPMVKR